MDFVLASTEEICAELGHRLKLRRLGALLTREEVAERAGLSPGAVRNLEGRGMATTETLVRVAQALGAVDELNALFRPRATSIDAMERHARAVTRRRAPKRAR